MRLGGVGVAAMATMAMFIVAVTARPSQDIFLGDRRPVYRGTHRTRDMKSDTSEVIVHSNINVMGRDEAEARKATAAPALGEALKTVTKQLLTDPAATDMVATDKRTPPHVGTQHEAETGHGEAVPQEHTETSQTATPTPTATPRTATPVTRFVSSTHRPTTPTPGGLSTWILLSDLTTTASSFKKKPSTAQTTKKPVTSVRPTATIEKIIKKGNETKVEMLNSVVASPLVATKKPTTDSTGKPMIPFDSKFKNRTPIVVGRIPAINKTKVEVSKKPNSTQVPVTTIEMVTKKKPTQLTAIKSTIYIPESVPTTSLLLESSTIGTPEGTSATSPTSSTKRPSNKNKNKKKNKIRRRRPTKDSTNAQSKIDTDLAETKIEGYNRPLSTRIYNYLAREVMPNVGVGLVGLMLTAGLAGLLLYPFGGVVARRNYEKAPPPDSSNMYYYNNNNYNPNNIEPGIVTPEDPVYGMSSSNVNSYSPNYDSKYNNHYRYDVPDYSNENVNGYAGMNDYSTLPDMVKNNQYSTIPENNKYYNNDPMTPISPQYKEGDAAIDDYNVDNSKYPSLTEYTAYTSASAIGTNSGIYEKPVQVQPTKEKDVVESKTESDDKEPQFSALSGVPNYSNTDFVGSVSVSGSYGADLGHRIGMLPMDHGPRNLKLKSRRKRSPQDLNNEVDSEIPDDKEATSTEKNIIVSTNAEVQTNPATAYEVITPSEESSTPVTTTSKTVTDFHEPIITVSILTDPHDGDYEIEKNEITKRPYEMENFNYDMTTEKQETTSVNNHVEEEYGLMAMLKRLFQMKLRVGINLIRSTSDALQRYVNRVTQRMEMAMKKLNRSSKSNESLSRRKRDLKNFKKTRPVKKYKQF